MRMNQILKISKIKKWYQLLFPVWIETRLNVESIIFEACILLPKILEKATHAYQKLLHELNKSTHGYRKLPIYQHFELKHDCEVWSRVLRLVLV